MGWDVWLLGLGMVLVLEGLLPFLSPSAWRETMLRLCQICLLYTSDAADE